MSAGLNKFRLGMACSLAAIALALTGMNPVMAAEKPTTEQIIQALTPKKLTRSLSGTSTEQAASPEERKFLNSLRTRTTRSLSTDERDRVASIAKDQPKIDLEIKFDFNSAKISKSALPDVEALGKALSNPSLKGSTFLVAGHTDAVGSPSTNQVLSDRRAKTIKRVLVDKYGIAPENLVTTGYGKTKLKNTSEPAAAENRRVEVVNMAEKVADR
jgi:outer membrane protein OmpA-like peptidoglycan-associated protein